MSAPVITADYGPLSVDAVEAAAARFAERARDLDRADADLREDILVLADLGLFDVANTPIAAVAAVLETVAAESLTVAFGAWAQRMASEYLHIASAHSESAARHYVDVSTGARPGVTGMAAAQRQAVGLGDVPLVATPTEDGYSLSGPIAWASNVYPESIIILAANTPDGRSLVLAVEASAPGVEIRKAPDLLALDATASTMLGLDDVRLTHDAVLGEDLPTFLRRCRPQFLVLQASFCCGIAGRALAESAGRLTGLGEFSADEHARLVEEHAGMRESLHRAAGDPHGQSLGDLLRLRLTGAELGPAATSLEARLAGGLGYARNSPANRRFREAAFLPVQSPSQAQLQWELARLEAAS